MVAALRTNPSIFIQILPKVSLQHEQQVGMATLHFNKLSLKPDNTLGQRAGLFALI